MEREGQRSAAKPFWKGPQSTTSRWPSRSSLHWSCRRI